VDILPVASEAFQINRAKDWGAPVPPVNNLVHPPAPGRVCGTLCCLTCEALLLLHAPALAIGGTVRPNGGYFDSTAGPGSFAVGYTVHSFALSHRHMIGAQPLASDWVPRAPVIPNDVLTPPHGKGRKTRFNPRVSATEGMLAIWTRGSNGDFAGAVVSLLDEVTQVSSHGSEWDMSLVYPTPC
jgi:hypothetical protein